MPMTFRQLTQSALELELEINRKNRTLKKAEAQQALEQASEYIPQILEWLLTAEKREKGKVTEPLDP